jgi:hypothetical protein
MDICLTLGDIPDIQDIYIIYFNNFKELKRERNIRLKGNI